MRALFAVAWLCISLGACAPALSPQPAPIAVNTGVDFDLATPEQTAALLASEDTYLRNLTPADISIRLQRPDTAGTLDQVKQLYRDGARAWTAAEHARLEAMIQRDAPLLTPLAGWLPDHILIMKLAPEIEGGLQHTRGAGIVMAGELPASDDALDLVFFHELFHVLSRANANRHDDLYRIVGFAPCNVDLPADLRARMISNPDAPLIQHAAPIDANDPALFATPVLLANPPLYDPAQPRFTSYFAVQIVALRRDAAGHCAPAADVVLDQKLLADAIYARAGRNTDYIFHPEELMADNFAQMMVRRTDAPNPEIYDRLAAVLGMRRP